MSGLQSYSPFLSHRGLPDSDSELADLQSSFESTGQHSLLPASFICFCLAAVTSSAPTDGNYRPRSAVRTVSLVGEKLPCLSLSLVEFSKELGLLYVPGTKLSFGSFGSVFFVQQHRLCLGSLAAFARVEPSSYLSENLTQLRTMGSRRAESIRSHGAARVLHAALTGPEDSRKQSNASSGCTVTLATWAPLAALSSRNRLEPRNVKPHTCEGFSKLLAFGSMARVDKPRTLRRATQ